MDGHVRVYSLCCWCVYVIVKNNSAKFQHICLVRSRKLFTGVFCCCVLVVGGKLRHSDVIKYVAIVLGGLLFIIATVVIVTCMAVKRHNLSAGQYLVY